MKTIVNIKEMQKSIKELNKVKCDKDYKTSNNIHIETLKNEIVLSINNFTTQFKKTLKAEVLEQGSTTFDSSIGKMLLKFKNNDLIIEDKNISCKNKKLEFNIEKFKQIETSNLKNEYSIESNELLRLLEVDYCTSKDETRPILQGICFKNNQTCALDGYRLSLRSSEKINFNAEFVVHGESIKILKSILTSKMGQVKIILYENYVVFNFNNYELTCKLLEGKYVKYEQLVPKEMLPNKIEINNLEYFKESILFAKETDKNDKPLVKFINENNQLKIQSNGLNAKYSDIIEDSIFTGDYKTIAFNIKYIEAILKNNKYENLTMNFASPVSPMIVSESYDKENLELVLPVRINK